MNRLTGAIMGSLALAGATAAEGAAVFDDVVVRQMWPWQTNVVVECSVRNVTGPSRVALALSADGEDLGSVPQAAFTTSRAFTHGGKLQLAFDPKAVPALTAKGRVERLQVVLTAEEVDAEDVLYVVYDLEKPGASQIVITDELRAGLWGTWEEQIWPSGATLTATGKPVWTGVTNNVYKLTKLVMRRIPAGTFKMGYASTADVNKKEPNISQRDVTLTKPYYIGVYPVTKKQVRLMSGSTNTAQLDYPTVNDTFNQIRGAYTTAGGPYDWPTDKTVDPASFIGKFRAVTGAALDLPTEAQWEKAARAGSSGVYYDGNAQTHKNERNAISWNKSSTEVAIHAVGLLKPNNYGLYDTLGNTWEWVLDWQAGAVDIATTDPEGPTAAGASYWEGGVPKRMLRGGSYNCDYYRITLHERTQNRVTAGGNEYGWRLAMPATEVDGGDAVVEPGVTVDATMGWQWMTAGANPGVVQWAWPSEAQSAKLTVAGRRTTVTRTFVPSVESFDLALALPTEARNEEVLDLQLDFYKSANATGTALKTLSVSGLGLLCAAPRVAVSDGAFASAKGKSVVLPVEKGQSLAVDDVPQSTGAGPCWFGWTGTYGLHALQQGEEDAVSVLLQALGLTVMLR